MTATQLATSPYAAGVLAVREHAAVERLRAVLDEVTGLNGDPGETGVIVDGHRVEMLRLMEEIKGALAAAQARVAVQFEASQLAQQDARGVGDRMRGRGISDQVAAGATRPPAARLTGAG